MSNSKRDFETHQVGDVSDSTSGEILNLVMSALANGSDTVQLRMTGVVNPNALPENSNAPERMHFKVELKLVDAVADGEEFSESETERTPDDSPIIH